MNVSRSIQSSFSKSLSTIKIRQGFFYILIFLFALIAFEAFSYSTTVYALTDLLGDLRFGGLRWAALLSIAFCGIDLAGITFLFANSGDAKESRRAWYMFGAWFLSAVMNTLLTWWGVVIAMQKHAVMSTDYGNPTFVTKGVPVIIALMVWVIRILLVGTLSKKEKQQPKPTQSSSKPALSKRELRQAQSQAVHGGVGSLRSVPSGLKSASSLKSSISQKQYKPEPTYIPMQDESNYQSVRVQSSARR